MKTVVFKGKEYKNYLVSEDSKVFNAKTGKELKQFRTGRRRELSVSLSENGKKRDVKVALLVLEAYKGRPTDITNKLCGLTWSVNHINGNIDDNNLINVEWRTVSENIKLYWADVKSGRRTR